MVNELESDIPKLISELEAIKERRETFIKATKANFNVFTTLRKEHEEVGLHSSFIGLLLNAKGLHDCDDLFLKLFIEVLSEGGVLNHKDKSCEIPFLNECRKDTFQRIEQEKRIADGQIDIGLFFTNAVLVIENKIHAYEQEDQISRYCKYLESIKQIPNNNKTMLYLTLDGKKSDTTGEYTDKYCRISYSQHIRKWLERCLEKTYKWSNINNAIQQYKDVVDKLTGKDTLAETDMKEIEVLISKHPQIIKYASDINRCVQELKSGYVDRLWKNFRNEVANKGLQFAKEPLRSTWQGRHYTGFFVNSHVSLNGDHGEQFRFLVEMEDVKRIYCGVGLDKEQIAHLNSRHKNAFGSVLSAVRENDLFNFNKEECNQAWPVDSIALLSMDDDWFINIISKDSEEKLKNAATAMSNKIKEYIDFVTEEWNKVLSKDSNKA